MIPDIIREKGYVYHEEPGIVLLRGDCLEILPLFEPDSFDMLFSDPPYGHGNHDGDLNAQLNKHRGIENKPIANDKGASFFDTMDKMLIEATRILKHDCCCCCCCCGGGGGPRPTFAWLANRMDTNGLTFFHSNIWDKVNPGLGWRYRRQHEMIMVSHRDGGKLLWADDKKAISNIFKFYPPRDRYHPNEKPVELCTYFIEAHAMRGQLILDPFGGSCTTAVAAKQLGRKCVVIELEAKYLDIGIERLRQEQLF
jgi:DNA modification methylase